MTSWLECNFNRYSLRTTIPLLLFTLGMILNLGSFLIERNEDDRAIEKRTEGRLTTAGDLMASLLEQDFRNDDMWSAESHVQMFSSTWGIRYVVFVDEENKIQLTSHPRFCKSCNIIQVSNHLPFSNALLERVRKTFSGQTVYDTKRNYLYGIFPVLLGKEKTQRFKLGPLKVGLLIAESEMVSMKAESHAISMTRLISTLSLLGIAMFATWVFLHFFITERIQKLARTLLEFGKGNFSASAGLSGQDELAHLSESLDEMAKSLEAKTATDREKLRLATILEESDAKLKRAINARDEFLSIASHELKTPLTALKLQLQINRRSLERSRQKFDSPSLGYTDALELIYSGLQKGYDLALRQVDSLASLIEDLLDISRVQTGNLLLSPRKTDLRELICDVVERYRGQLTHAHCRIHLNLEPQIIGWWDQQRLDQVLVNLIGNILKYAQGSDVTIRSRKLDDHAELIIHDTGPGIPEGLRSSIFNRFERGENCKGVGGLGLGLFIVKSIVDAHHGSITLDTSVTRGTCFRIELPLHALRCTDDSIKEVSL